jgi:hypothetical protein
MMAWMTGKALPYLIAAAVALAAASLFTLGVAKLGSMIDTAREEAKTARDAYWKGQIAETNAKVSAAAASLARMAMQKDAELAEADRKLRDQQAETEAQNAALPGADDCGLSRDRVRLLKTR